MCRLSRLLSLTLIVAGFAISAYAADGNAAELRLQDRQPAQTGSAIERSLDQNFLLNLSLSGPSSTSGVVTLSIPNATCGGAPCSTPGGSGTWSVASGTTVVLTAAPGANATFAGWGGACSGTSTTCSVVMNSNQSVTATFSGGSSSTSLLTVTQSDSSQSVSGTITSSPAGINCNGYGCGTQVGFPTGQTIVLTATPASGSSFQGWGGACSGTAPTCTVILNSSLTVTAAFTASNGGGTGTQYPLAMNITYAGSAGGTIVSNPQGLFCANVGSSSCATSGNAYFNSGTTVVLTATPASGSTFQGWGGACSGTATTCSVVMNSNQNVTAAFAAASSFTLSTSTSGNGTGSVTSSPGNISCGTNCNASLAAGTSVQLTATPASGSTFQGWGGACSGTATTCTVVMNSNQTVTASFATTSGFTLTASNTGNGTGSVTSSPGNISCGTNCSASLAAGTTVVLTATPASGSTFQGWGGACSGTATTCTVVMNSNQTVTASFAASSGFTLTVSRLGNGTGSVSSSVGNISCGTNCSASLAAATSVQLTATPASGSTFQSWGGACSGTATTCTVVMTSNQTVTASFTSHAGLDGSSYLEIAPTFNGSDGNQSFIRLGNGGTAATTFNITVVGSPSGAIYGTGALQVPANASPQYALSQILTAAAAGPLANGDTSYSLYLQDADKGLSIQHVIYNGANGFFENASVCKYKAASSYTALNAQLANIHTSSLPTYPSEIYLHNYSSSDATYDAAVYDSASGTMIGAVLLTLGANSTYYVPFSWFEQQLGWTPTGSQLHANMVFQAVGSAAFEAEVGQYIYNQKLSAYVNMTQRCGM